MKHKYYGMVLFASVCLFTVISGRADTITWTNTAGGNWNDTANWLPNQVPGLTDDAEISSNGTYAVTLNINTTVNSLKVGGEIGTQTLDVGSHTLALNNASGIGTNGILILTSGSLTASNLTLSGQFNWNSGTLNNGTMLTVFTSGTLNLTNSGIRYFYGSLTNDGTVVMGSSSGAVNLYGYNPATICNNGLWLCQSNSSRQFVNADGLPGKSFVNTGTLRQTGTGTTTMNWPFTTVGIMDQQIGTFDVQTWIGANTIHGIIKSLGGAFAAGSTLTIAADGNLSLTNSGTYYLYGILTNNGAVVMGSSSGAVNIYTYDPARIYNYGTWTCQLNSSRQIINADGLTNKLFLNAGTLQQTGNGTTTIGVPFTTTGLIDQQAGFLSMQAWDGTSVLHGDSLSFNGAVGSDGTSINVATNTMLNLISGATVKGMLTVDAGATLALTNSGTCYLYGTLTNNGTVVIGSISGAVNLYGYESARIYNNALLISQSNNSRNFINADGLTNKLFLNLGTIQQTGSGTLTLGWPFTTTGTFDQQVGLLNVLTWVGTNILHGTPVFSGDVGSANTVTEVASNTVLNLVNGNAMNGTLTVDLGGYLNLTNAGTISLHGTLTNNGTVLMGTTAGTVNFYGYESSRIWNNNLWIFQSSNTRQFINADGLTNKLLFNTGTFQQTGSGTTTFAWPFTTTGLIDQQAGSLSVTLWTGESILHGVLVFSGNIGSPGATVYVAGGSAVNLINGNTLDGIVAVNAGANLSLTNTGTYSLRGTLTNSGTITMGSAAGVVNFYAYNSASVYNDGWWISQSGNTRQFINADGLPDKLFLNAGTFQQTNSGSTTMNWPFTSSGATEIHSGALNLNDLFVQTAGLTTLHGGTLSSAQPFQLLGGMLAGTNTITASVTNNGVVSPGLSPGKLHITGDYTQTTNGTLQIELGGTSPGVTFDQLTVSGSARLAGTLTVSLTNDFLPLTNSTFTILTAGTKLGAFGDFFYPSNVIGAQVLYTPGTAYLFITNAPPRFGPYVDNGNFVAHFFGLPGTNYTIEWTPVLPSTNWQKLTNVVAPLTDYGLGTGVLQIIDPVTISNRFYRTVTPAY